MERTIGTFGLADFYAGQKRSRPNFLDAVAVLIKWERIEDLLKKKAAPQGQRCCWRQRLWNFELFIDSWTDGNILATI